MLESGISKSKLQGKAVRIFGIWKVEKNGQKIEKTYFKNNKPTFQYSAFLFDTFENFSANKFIAKTEMFRKLVWNKRDYHIKKHIRREKEARWSKMFWKKMWNFLHANSMYLLKITKLQVKTIHIFGICEINNKKIDLKVTWLRYAVL